MAALGAGLDPAQQVAFGNHTDHRPVRADHRQPTDPVLQAVAQPRRSSLPASR